ncbi:MAG: glycosyltransferase family 2 protein [Lachnospiraceae bacterium]
MEIKVSVIMPAYNAQKFIRQAITSVCHQSGKIGRELLIIDDGSTDQTEAQVLAAKAEEETEECQIIYIKQEKNSGVAEARNVGIRRARGAYVAFLDADDWWSEEKLEVQMKYAKKHPDSVLICTGRELMNEDGSPQYKEIPVPERITYSMLLETNYIPCSSVLLKTEVAREFYMCHDELHEDYILWLSVLKKYKTAVGIDKPLLKSRLSKDGKSRNKFKSVKMQYGVYRYIGLGRVRSLRYLVHYALNGVQKYRG